MLRAIFALGLIALLPTAAGAEACGNRGDIVDYLHDQYGETPVSSGFTHDGRVIEILVSANGTWTVIVTAASGKTCGLAAGEALSVTAEDIARSEKRQAMNPRLSPRAANFTLPRS